MYIDNIASNGVTLNSAGKSFQIEVYEKIIKNLQEEEQSTTSNLARRILKAIEYINDNIAVCAFNNKELPHWEFDDNNIQELLKILGGE